MKGNHVFRQILSDQGRTMNRQGYIEIDVMDEHDDQHLCTLRYPKPALWPLFPVDMRNMIEFIRAKRPTLFKKRCIYTF